MGMPSEKMNMVSRRGFLGMGANATLAALVPPAHAYDADISLVHPRSIAIECGLEKPFKVLHVSDTHLSLMNGKELEDACRRKLHDDRNGSSFPHGTGERMLAATTAYARMKNLPIVHTGDLIDFVSEANLAVVDRFSASRDVYAVAGNHEWAFFMYTKREDVRFNRSLFLARHCAVFHNDMDVSVRTWGGVNLVAFDNWDFQVDEHQERAIKAAFSKGLPTVLLCHCPFYTPRLHADCMARTKGRYSDLLGIPADEMERICKATPSQVWRKPTARTTAFVEWLKGQSNLKAILCGHLHRYHSEQFSPSAMQYAVGANANGDAYEITFA